MNKLKIFIGVFFLCGLSANLIAQRTTEWGIQPVTIATRWAKEVSPTNVLPEYPRPQMLRKKWTNLNGLWDYVITNNESDAPSKYHGRILVPFPIESALSGVKKKLQPAQLLWYQRTIAKPVLKSGERVLLHFGAVDYEAIVFLNGKKVGEHIGGYQNFTLDITDKFKTGRNTLSVKVWDPTDTGPNPHGKQTLTPGGIMYTSSSGIWQTVWLEVVPPVYIAKLKMTPDVDAGKLDLKVILTGDLVGHTVEATASATSMSFRPVSSERTEHNSTYTLQLPIENAKLWSPNDPFLYDLVVRIKKGDKVIDEVKSYFGMRKVEVKKDDKGVERIFLNNKYTYNLGTLDQGYWPDGLYTAPTDEALKFDIIAAKVMGFNTIRKHIKIEPARWYYHCDKLGMLVWQDMVNPGNDSKEAQGQFEKESAENLAQLHNYPSITTWVLFNEGWGTYDQARLTKWMKDKDPSRIVNGHSGENYFDEDAMTILKKKKNWQTSENSDMTDIHAYPPPALPNYLPGKARVLGEFGGIGVSVENHLWDDIATGWGYGDNVDPIKMRERYALMVDSLVKFEKMGLSGSIYTQPFDVESEQNGLMTYDRKLIKIPLATLRKIHSRLWPATKNYEATTKSFSVRLTDTVIRSYAARLTEYAGGKRDSSFLRSLAIMAYAQKDKENVTKISGDYIKQLKNPFTETNLKFIQKFSFSSRHPGYDLIMKNLNRIASVMDPKPFRKTVQEIIFKEEVKPLLTEHPKWEQVDEVIHKYSGIIDGELINGLAVIHYLSVKTADKAKYSKNVVAAATRYDDLYKDGAYNTWAWVLFKASSDRTQLIKALEWSKKEIERTAKDSDRYGGYLDTYANLLYKLGRTAEALEWQAKAVEALPNDAKIKEVYLKMKSGTPTWE